ncbi:TPA: restriction endonuclease subunit S [Escherichia coli]|uniref:restriction endonuclease subunit S n=1 Tax=Escherichia coli TaxID=562 RepID=UPI000BE2118C|nr:restriction endonuclease subunit S [Escherichia coli]EHS0462584.1 restriction endonuclease subunit S [Escherichia coli]EII4853770.1 restriction endonuclease subunit S [Escherichia coli]EIQ9234328.1 restriction endonuclease subunit S [Escherichia coli]EIX4562785.1 restriction endonuclease subunit S [Escherichia coli]EKP7836517.1 restriction endonuclease subunit S [Escherichia coli]
MAGLNKYQAYPEYRDSGVEWIDAIPFHWEVLPTFSLCEASTKKNIDGAENNVLSLSYGKIIPRDIETNFGLLPESFNTYQIVENGDIILRLTDLQNDKNSLRVGLVKQKGIITSAYLKLNSQGSMLSEYLYRLLHSYDTTKVFYGMGGGLRQSMKFEDFRRLPLLLPSKNEQGKIIDFLDHETAKIDNLIEKQQQLIELLKEKRQAVISHAVTKGLNPDVPMKDSGVEWLGEVPKHWHICKLKWFANLKSGDFITSNSIEPEGNYPVYGGNGLRGYYSHFTHNGEYVLIGRQGALCGNINYAIGKFWASEHAVVVTPNERAVTIWLGELLRIMNLNQYSVSAAQPGLAVERITDLYIPIPPYQEQINIGTYISKYISLDKKLIEHSTDNIELLKERRTALISAAVTGKIDLRNWTAPIPEAETPTEVSA